MQDMWETLFIPCKCYVKNLASYDPTRIEVEIDVNIFVIICIYFMSYR